MSYTSYLLIDHIQIQGANALSSPLTYGFPAINGFLGAIHALDRHLSQQHKSEDQKILLGGVGIVSHQCNIQRYRSKSGADYSFNQTRNPLKKDGKVAAIIEEGKAQLTLSLVVEVIADRNTHRALKKDSTDIQNRVNQQLLKQRVAGGSITQIKSVKWFDSVDTDELTRALLPGFVLMDARAELISITQELQQQQPEATALDGLIEAATLHHLPPDPKSGKKDWQTKTVKTGLGWLVPMPVGYQGLAEEYAPHQLAHCRSPQYPSQYVEAIYSLGKWVFPYSIQDLTHIFWRYAKSQDDLYLITQTQHNI